MTVVEELVSVLGLEIGEDALATLSKFRTAVTKGLAGVGGVVAALGAAFAGTVVSVAELGTEINTTSIRLGVGTDAIQELKYAADLTNVSFESLTTAMKFLSKNAAEGGDAAKKVFEAFSGISMRDAQGHLKTVDVLIEDFADKIANTKDPIKQMALAMHALHGQSGAQLLPLLKLGKKGIQELRQEAIDLGYVLDHKTIESSARFTVSLKHLKNALLGIRNTVGSPFIDDFSEALDWLTERVRASREWFQGLTKDIRDLGQRFGRLLTTAKQAIEGIRKFTQAIRLDALASAVHWTEMLEAALIGVGVVAVTSAAATAGSWLLAAAPFLIIATLIGLIVDDIAHFVTGGESVLGEMDKWAKRFSIDDSPEIKFFKSLLQLLFDLGDPAKWKRVGKAAEEGLFSVIVRLREALGLPSWKFGQGAGEEPMLHPTKPMLQHTKKPFEISPKELAAKSDEEYADWIRQQNQWQYALKYSSKGPTPTQDMPMNEWANMSKGSTPNGKGPIVQQNISVTVHGAENPDDPEWAKKVQEVIDKALSDAKAATTGGS